MTDHPLEHLADDLAQELFNYDRRCQGKQPYPLTATSTLHRDEIGPLLAEVEAYSWSPDACPPLSFTGGKCANPDPLPHRCYGACGVHTKPSEPTGHSQ